MELSSFWCRRPAALLSTARHVERNFDARLQTSTWTGSCLTTVEVTKTLTRLPISASLALQDAALGMVLADLSRWTGDTSRLRFGVAARSATELPARPARHIPRPDACQDALYAAATSSDQQLRVIEQRLHGRSARKQQFSIPCHGRRLDELEARHRCLPQDAVGGAGGARASASSLAILFQVRFGLRPLRAIRHELAAIRCGGAERLGASFRSRSRPVPTELNVLDPIQPRDRRSGAHPGRQSRPCAEDAAQRDRQRSAQPWTARSAARSVEQARAMREQVTHYLDRARGAARVGALAP